MKKLILMSILILSSSAFAQGTFGTGAKYEYRYLIDVPTAGVLEKGVAGMSFDVMPWGVLVSKIEVGVFTDFSFGISYGAANLIGKGNPDWYKLPGVNLRFRALNESEGLPALTIGFDSQGKGAWFDGVDRYEIKSPGFFAAVSKNFEFLGYLGLHGVVNYSLEREDGDKDLNIAFGVEKTIGSKFSIIAEYDFAINDNNETSIGDGSGYLNMGFRWSVGDGFTVGGNLRNLLSNNKLNSYNADRGIFIEYAKSLF